MQDISPSKNPAPAEEAEQPSWWDDLRSLAASLKGWCRANPVGAALLVILLGVVGYFYFGVKAFLGLSQSPAQWMAAAWNPENDQEHGWAVIPIALVLVFLQWRAIRAAPKQPSNWGLILVVLGIFAYVAGVRCTQGRYAILALPLLALGTVVFLWGGRVGRIILFPAVFLLFMIPIGGIIQGTVGLQVITGKAIYAFSKVLGIPIQISGTNILSTDNRFEPMEVAGGCSGIRSLMAMMTLSALYAYFTMRGVLRGLILFGGSLVFAVIGNFVRVFSVVLFAVYIDPKRAIDLYHDFSGFVFFPAAILAMVGFGNLLNRNWGAWLKRENNTPDSGNGDSSNSSASWADDSKKPAGPISYDY